MAAPRLSVLIVSWNARELLAACLDSLAASVRSPHEVIVADNGSSDGSQAMLAGRAGREGGLEWFETGGNVGFARANNLALERARGERLLLLNPDTVALPGALDAMLDHLDRHPEVGVVAPRLLNTDGSDQETARAFPTPAAALFGRRSLLRRLFPNNRWSRRYLTGSGRSGDEPFAVEWVSGACLLVTREAVARAGRLDEGFFMHFEDADWCFRIRRAGLAVHCLPAARVLHHQGGSRRGWPPGQVIAFHRGAFRFYRKHRAPQRLHPMRAVALAGLSLRAALLIAAFYARSATRPRVSPRRPVTAEET